MTLREQKERLSERLGETRKAIQKNIGEVLEKWSIGKSVEKQVQALQANIEKAFKLTLLSLNVATRDQIDFLNKRIELLNEKLESFAEKPEPKAKPKAKPKKKKTAAKKTKKAKS